MDEVCLEKMEGNIMKLKTLTKFFTKEKMPIILLLGILLVVISIPMGKGKTGNTETVKDTDEITELNYVEELETKLETLLRQTNGVGENCVMITVKNNGKEILYSQKDGISKPYVQGVEMPEIQGVLIIAEGADKVEIVKAVSEAASTLLNIPMNKVKVMKMEVSS